MAAAIAASSVTSHWAKRAASPSSLDDLLAEVGLDVGDHDLGSLLDEAPRARRADTTRCAGDDGDLSGQPIAHQPSPWIICAMVSW